MTTCEHCGKDISDPHTTTCIKGYIEYQDDATFTRIPMPTMRKDVVLCATLSPAPSTTRDAILNAAHGAAKDSYRVGA